MRKSNVIILDTDINVSVCTVRQMTNEERERYGLPPLEHEDHTVRIIPAVKKEKPKNAIKEETEKMSQKILKERAALCVSAKKFSQIVGISQPTLSKIERLKTNASPETLEKLNEYFKKKDGD